MHLEDTWNFCSEPKSLTFGFFQNYFLFQVRPNSLAQSTALALWLNITENIVSGYWTGYMRLKQAPLKNGKLSRKNKILRASKHEYFDLYSGCPRVMMPKELWRTPSQPGDQKDERDERCVARKRPGQVPENDIVGMDSYPCNGKGLHYVICEKCEKLWPEGDADPVECEKKKWESIDEVLEWLWDHENWKAWVEHMKVKNNKHGNFHKSVGKFRTI